MEEALGQYMANIEATQRRDHADAELILQYLKLADRTIAAEAKSRTQDAPQAETLQPAEKAGTTSSPRIPATSAADEVDTKSLLALRQQLAAAQKARALLETHNAQIPALENLKQSQARQITSQEREISALKRRLGDREEEVKEKQKLAAHWQDEMIMLNLQVNAAEDRAVKLETENKTLLERWMKEMEGRADKMNKDAGW